MDIEVYTLATNHTAQYPGSGESTPGALAYVGLGLSGEAGEVGNQLKKILRDDAGEISEERRKVIQKELGDVLWYWARVHVEVGLTPSDTMMQNLEKLTSRKERGVIGGSGDDR